MENYKYISTKVIKIGGRIVSASDLTTLDAKTLELAIQNKVIKKEHGKKSEKPNSEDGANASSSGD